MATPECIEFVDPSSSPNVAGTPSSSALISTRPMTVSYGQRGAMLRLQGDWFKETGFPIGTKVTVYVARGLLVVQALPTPKPEPPRVTIERVAPPPPSDEIVQIIQAFASKFPDTKADPSEVSLESPRRRDAAERDRSLPKTTVHEPIP